MTGRHRLIASLMELDLGEVPELGPLCDGDWRRVRFAMFAGNVGGLLAAAVQRGIVRVDDVQRNELVEHLVTRLVRDARVEAECVAVTELLRAEGIDSVVLKGLATAHLDHPDPSHRSSNDVDLLVRADQLPEAVAVLKESGFARDLPERRRGFDQRFAKDVTMIGPNRVEIDLHRTLVRGPYGAAIALDELWHHVEPLAVPGLPNRRALDGASRLLHASYTAVVADRSPTLATVRDLALLAHSQEMDWDAVHERADRWRCDDVLSDALHIISPLVKVPFPDRSGTGGVRRSAWRGSYGSGGGSTTSTMLAMVGVLPVRHKLPYLRGLLAPSRAYRRARHAQGRRSEWRTGMRELLAHLRRATGKSR